MGRPATVIKAMTVVDFRRSVDTNADAHVVLSARVDRGLGEQETVRLEVKSNWGWKMLS
jgi:hypothetical protein